MKMNTLLSVKNLRVSFRQEEGADTHAVRGISFEINKGETLAIVGESGSGKSVTALSIMRLLPYPMAYHPTGSVCFDGLDVGRASGPDLRRIRNKRIGFVFQDPMTSLNPLQPIGDQIMEVLIHHQSMDQTQAFQQALTLLKHVRLRDASSRMKSFPFQLSGGERQRIMIAIAIANKPDLLIADEPTTALDVTVQAQILDILSDLRKKFRMSILLISHDLTVVQSIADRVLVMRQGKIVESGSADKIFKNPESDYTHSLINAIPKGFLPIKKKEHKIIEGENISVSFSKRSFLDFRRKPRTYALKDVSFCLYEGETLGIVGESGSGKSTLAQSIVKLAPFEGCILVFGQALKDLPKKALKKIRPDLQLVFQDPYSSLNPKFTVGDLIGEPLQVHEGMETGELKQTVLDILRSVRLDPSLYERYPHMLSGGQRQRVALARALALKPKILILDEPTSSLDLSVQKDILTILRVYQKKQGTSILFISHDLRVIKSISHRVMVMQKGKIVESGLVRDIFLRPQKSYTKALIQSAFMK